MVLEIGSVFSALSTVVFDRGARDDDTVDRLNHMVMYGLLISLGVAAGTRQYVGSAIYCWSPAEFTEKIHRRYIHHYCWVSAMYNVPFDEFVPAAEDDRYFNDVNYYKMITALFLLLAVLFRVPQLIWKELSRSSEANMELLVGMTTETVFMEQEERDDQLRRIAEYFHRWITIGKPSTRNSISDFFRRILTNVICRGRLSGYTLVYSYLFIKFLYLINVFSQFFIISAFLKTNYWKLGVNAMTSYVRNGQWEDEYNFPRVTHCDVKIRQLENVHTYTVQCVLAINLFLEKMFLLLWICLVLMLFINTISLVKWLFQVTNESRSILFLWKFFGQCLSGRLTSLEDRRKYLFMLRRYLKADGLFVVRMVSVNTTDMLTSDLARQIWLRYKSSLEEGSRLIPTDGVKLNGNATPSLNDSDDEQSVYL